MGPRGVTGVREDLLCPREGFRVWPLRLRFSKEARLASSDNPHRAAVVVQEGAWAARVADAGQYSAPLRGGVYEEFLSHGDVELRGREFGIVDGRGDFRGGRRNGLTRPETRACLRDVLVRAREVTVDEGLECEAIDLREGCHVRHDLLSACRSVDLSIYLMRAMGSSANHVSARRGGVPRCGEDAYDDFAFWVGEYFFCRASFFFLRVPSAVLG